MIVPINLAMDHNCLSKYSTTFMHNMIMTTPDKEENGVSV